MDLQMQVREQMFAATDVPANMAVTHSHLCQMRTLPRCHGPEDARIGAKAYQSRQDCARVSRRRRLCACSSISHVTSA
jgi:hypothetical protein